MCIPVRGCCLATSHTFTAMPAALTRMPSTVGWNCNTSTWVSSGPSTSPGPGGSSWPEAGSRHSFTCRKEQVCEPRARRGLDASSQPCPGLPDLRGHAWAWAVCLCWGPQGREVGLGSQVWLEDGGKWGWESQASHTIPALLSSGSQAAGQQVKAIAVNILQHMGARVG